MPPPAKKRQRQQKTVTFGTVQVREYLMCLGDNPACDSGPPLSLSWDYIVPRSDKDVVEYERRRGPSRLHGTQLRLPPDARRAILRRLGESEERMDRVAQELRTVQISRESSVEDDDSKFVGHPPPKLAELYSTSRSVMRKIWNISC